VQPAFLAGELVALDALADALGHHRRPWALTSGRITANSSAVAEP
jgi:hypothetical protein